MHMKKFIITIDTEGDNLWTWKPGDSIATENTLFLERFQKKANAYGFKPVWLTNYEMIQDDRYIEFISKVEQDGRGELGMHLHAWSTPPEYSLSAVNNGAPYLVEYPKEVMEEKIKIMTESIFRKTGVRPISHRAGRWAMNDVYFQLLEKYGYKIDCSVTPHVNWSKEVGQSENSKGSDYTAYPAYAHMIGNILEVPVSICQTKRYFFPYPFDAKQALINMKLAINGQNIWLRPRRNNVKQMAWLLKEVNNSDADYVMFMLHSSELMPGGSPTFKNEDQIEKMYDAIEYIFQSASRHFEGITLREYYDLTKEVVDH